MLKSLLPLLFFFLITFNSCESFIGNDINVDPNNPIDVPLSAQLPSIQLSLVDVYGGEFARTSCMLVQQVYGAARQCVSFSNYTGMSPNRFNTMWLNIYENVLNETKIVSEKAVKAQYFHYEAIADICTAFILISATDVWDDMPFSEALQGIDNFNPGYDTQDFIYEQAFELLDQAIHKIDGPNGGLSVGSDDILYQGDMDKWKKVAHAILARAHLKLKNFDMALSFAMSSLQSQSDNFGFAYPNANSASPWYRFNRDRTGDIEFTTWYGMGEIMETLNDTARLKVLNQNFNTQHSYLSADKFVELISYREMLFVIAECDWRLSNGSTDVGYEAYLEGISLSFDEMGLNENDYNNYVSQVEVDPGKDGLNLESIMTQKYLGLFSCPEVYSDWRRTNIPSLRPTTGDQIPVRWPYPEDEHSFNSNAPDAGSINIFRNRVGWNRN